MKRYTHCRHCGKPKKIPTAAAKDGTSRRAGSKATKPSAYANPSIYESDPYCSRPCLEADLGIKDPRSPMTSTAGMLGRQGGASRLTSSEPSG